MKTTFTLASMGLALAMSLGTASTYAQVMVGGAPMLASKDIIDRFSALPFLNPDRQDHIDAAQLRNHCRRSGVQTGTIDALLAQLCIRHTLTLLTTDKDFVHVASHCPLRLWKQA